MGSITVDECREYRGSESFIECAELRRSEGRITYFREASSGHGT